ncbi:MAG: 2-aminobenzoate-CoA ligase, partial [Luteibaculum sp.]
MQSYPDPFVENNLPQAKWLPDILLNDPIFHHPESLNAVHRLLDHHVLKGSGHKACLFGENSSWTYQQLFERANQ